MLVHSQTSLVPSRTPLALCAEVRLVSRGRFLGINTFTIWNLRWLTRAQQNDAIAIHSQFSNQTCYQTRQLDAA